MVAERFNAIVTTSIIFAIAIAMPAANSNASNGGQFEMPVNSYPPPLASTRYERSLGKVALANSCPDIVKKVGKIVADYPGINLQSEKASFSNEFGYVFRYLIFGKVQPEVGGSAEVIGMLVVWTKDCEKFHGVTYSSYDFPSD